MLGGRHICWTDNRITIEAETEHVDQLFRDLDTPAATHPRDVQREELWDVVQAKVHRRSAGRVACLSLVSSGNQFGQFHNR